MAVWQQVVGRPRLRFDFSVPDHVAEYLPDLLADT
jgi:hypothetical protein